MKILESLRTENIPNFLHRLRNRYVEKQHHEYCLANQQCKGVDVPQITVRGGVKKTHEILNKLEKVADDKVKRLRLYK